MGEGQLLDPCPLPSLLEARRDVAAFSGAVWDSGRGTFPPYLLSDAEWLTEGLAKLSRSHSVRHVMTSREDNHQIRQDFSAQLA
jgi:hypothetical protein